MVNDSPEKTDGQEKSGAYDRFWSGLANFLDNLYINGMVLAGYPKEAVVEYLDGLAALEKQLENLKTNGELALKNNLQQSREDQALQEFIDDMGGKP